MESMNGKIVLVTGSCSGIGRQTAIELAALGATVLLHARSTEEGLRVLSELLKIMPNASFDLFAADFEKQHQVHKMVSEIEASYSRLDVLINNAAVYEKQKKFSADTIEKTFAVNHLAPFLLTHLLMRLMNNAVNPRIINVSSQAHFQSNFDSHNLQGEKTYNGVDMYCATKLCNLLFTYMLADKLKHQRVKVNAVHPGLVATELYMGLFTEFEAEMPQDAADTIVYMASSPEVEIVSGEYFMSRIPIQSSYNSYTRRYQKQLWELSERLTGIESSTYITTEKAVRKRTKRLRHALHNLFKMANRAMKRKNDYEYNVH